MIKVLIVAVPEKIQECLSNLVKKENKYKLIGCISNGNRAIEICSENAPDLVIVYVSIQENIDYNFIKEVKTLNKNIKIIILSLGEDKKDIMLALKYGADGYLINDESMKEVLTLMEKSYSKVKYIHKKSFSSRKKSIHENGLSSEVRFTFREKEVLELVTEGYTNHEIGAILGISVGRTRNIVADLIAKCMVKNRTQLAVMAVKIDMLSLNSDKNELYE